MTLNDLGRPYDITFVRLQGVEGQTLYPKAGVPLATSQGYMEHAFVKADSEQILAANASAWGIDANVAVSQHKRYASYQAFQIVAVYEVDDTTPQRKAPSHAVYYPWRIYVGHSYEMLFEGNEDTFGLGVQANPGVYAGGIEAYASANNLESRIVGHGMESKGKEAIFARTPEAIEGNYRSTGKPVAVLVEWRRIPGKKGKQGKIAWKEPKRCAGQRGCRPCEEWEFSSLEWTLPRLKKNGSTWDVSDNVPEVLLRLKAGEISRISPIRSTTHYKWLLSPGLRLPTGADLMLTGQDRDMMAHDFIGALKVQVAAYLPEGKLMFPGGAAHMIGRCVVP